LTGANIHRIGYSIDKKGTDSIPPKRYSSIYLHNLLIRSHGKEAAVKIKKFHDNYEKEHYHGWIPNPGLIDFIKNNKKYALFLWTGNSTQIVNRVLHETGLKENSQNHCSK
jgi:hypothetical protein